jgi:hypothetical protein
MKKILLELSTKEAEALATIVEEVGVKKAYMPELHTLEPVVFDIRKAVKKTLKTS